MTKLEAFNRLGKGGPAPSGQAADEERSAEAQAD
jgi:hypothetical protein